MAGRWPVAVAVALGRRVVWFSLPRRSGGQNNENKREDVSWKDVDGTRSETETGRPGRGNLQKQPGISTVSTGECGAPSLAASFALARAARHTASAAARAADDQSDSQTHQAARGRQRGRRPAVHPSTRTKVFRCPVSRILAAPVAQRIVHIGHSEAGRAEGKVVDVVCEWCVRA